MKKLKRGARVVAVYMNGDGQVLRGRVGGRDHRQAYSEGEGAPHDTWLNTLNKNAEGVVWARGWYTAAARALRSAVALAQSPTLFYFVDSVRG